MKIHKLLLLVPALLCASCRTKNVLNDKNLVIGCSPTPHAEILEAARPLFKEKGYKLEIKVLNDYVTPNTMLDTEDLDANYFQHRPYLNDFNESNHTDLTWLCAVHFEPMGIYSSKHKDLSKKNPLIAVPNDVSNNERAKELLNSLGIIGTLKEVEAQALPSVLQDVDYAVINGNYALSAKIIDKCLATEDSTSAIAERNANVIAIKKTSEKYEWTNVIKEVFASDEIRQFINTNYGTAVKAVF